MFKFGCQAEDGIRDAHEGLEFRRVLFRSILVDREGEFRNLAGHIGATSLKACELTADGLTAAAARARQHRLSLHIDLTDLDPDQRILKAAALFAGLIGAPSEHWANTVLVCIDEGDRKSTRLNSSH